MSCSGCARKLNVVCWILDVSAVKHGVCNVVVFPVSERGAAEPSVDNILEKSAGGYQALTSASPVLTYQTSTTGSYQNG